MAPYIIVTIFVIFMGLLTHRDKKTMLKVRQSKNITVKYYKSDIISIFGFVIISIVLILFAGLRGGFTTDYNNYLYYFNYFNSFSFKEIINPNISFTMEKGYVLLTKFIGCFTDSGLAYMFIISTVTLILFLNVFKNNSSMPWLSILLFISIGDYYTMFNASRQLLATAIILCGLKYINNNGFKDFFKFFILVILATSIHTTSIVLLPFYFLLKLNINKKNILIYTAIVVLLYLLLPQIISLGQKLFPKYKNYPFGMGAGSFNAVIPYLAITIVIIFFNTLSDYKNDDIKNRVLISGTFFATCILFLATRVYIILRFSYLFKSMACIALSNYVTKIKDKAFKSFAVLFICILAVLFVYVTMYHTGYNPYYFNEELGL